MTSTAMAVMVFSVLLGVASKHETRALLIGIGLVIISYIGQYDAMTGGGLTYSDAVMATRQWCFLGLVGLNLWASLWSMVWKVS